MSLKITSIMIALSFIVGWTAHAKSLDESTKCIIQEPLTSLCVIVEQAKSNKTAQAALSEINKVKDFAEQTCDAHLIWATASAYVYFISVSQSNASNRAAVTEHRNMINYYIENCWNKSEIK